MSAGETKVRVVIDVTKLVEALERLGAMLEEMADPLRSRFAAIAKAIGRGERPCGRPHGDLAWATCTRCGAAV